jgi:repressor LexA
LETLSIRRRRILDSIRENLSQRGFPPTVREIGQAVGISSTSVVDFHLRALEEQGFIRRARDLSRGIELLLPDGETPLAPQVPIAGVIAAGLPIEAIEGDMEALPLPPGLAGPIPLDELFALRVKGDSMIEELIGDGDIIVARRQSTAQDGDIVVALLTKTPTPGWGATLKRFYHEGHQIRLQPANSTMEPIFVHPADLQIQGKLVALIRQY